MYFSDNDLEELRNGYLAVAGKHQQLTEGYLIRAYKGPRAREYATQGFLRRLKTLVRCIDRIFQILPPDRTDLPTSDELSDAMINLQAFVFNVFGATDNLAWIWVQEKGLVSDDGSPIPGTWVGLREKNKSVRGSFSVEFQEYLKGLNGWFELLEGFRHALAHRIPLYIPPYVVSTDDEAAYRELEDRMAEAITRHDFAEHERLSSEQKALAAFRPHMTHSFEERAAIIVFHPQLLADFNTIEELGQRMLEELDRLI